jgi:hypothetical protein
MNASTAAAAGGNPRIAAFMICKCRTGALAPAGRRVGFQSAAARGCGVPR